MNIYDIAIGFLIGIFAERFLKVTTALQKLIKEQKERKKKLKEKNEAKSESKS
jgi:hypothetical protein